MAQTQAQEPTLADRITVSYQGWSEEGRENWLAAQRDLAMDAAARRIPIYNGDDEFTRDNKLAKRQQIVAEREQEFQDRLAKVEERIFLAGVELPKGKDVEIDFLKFKARSKDGDARFRLKRKFATAIATGKLALLSEAGKAVGNELRIVDLKQKMRELQSELAEAYEQLEAKAADGDAEVDEEGSDELVPLSKRSRGELNEIAADLGIEDAEKLPNIAAVIAAIEAKSGGGAE